jgi:hypothetical protein
MNDRTFVQVRIVAPVGHHSSRERRSHVQQGTQFPTHGVACDAGQEEFGHELRREREAAAALAGRCQAAEARADELQASLQRARDEQQAAPEAQLARQLADARAELARVQEDAARAGAAKQQYKEQVCHLEDACFLLV